MRYAWEACEALLRDETSVSRIRKPEGNPRLRWDVAVVDGAFPECLLGVLHGENVPTIMLNTVIPGFPSSSNERRNRERILDSLYHQIPEQIEHKQAKRFQDFLSVIDNIYLQVVYVDKTNANSVYTRMQPIKFTIKASFKHAS